MADSVYWGTQKGSYTKIGEAKREKILSFTNQFPGSRVTDIAASLKIGPQSALIYIKDLESYDQVKRIPSGRESLCFTADCADEEVFYELHKREETMLNYIAQNPGTNISEIHENLGVDRTTLRKRIKFLEDNGAIKSKIQGPTKKLFAKEYTGPFEKVPATAKLVLEARLNNPNDTPSELSRALGMSHQLVRYHLSRYGDAA